MLKKQPTKKNKILEQVKYWALLNFGILIMSVGIYLFEAPNEFVMGGMSGFSIFIYHFTSQVESLYWLTQPLILAALNIFLLIVGFFFLGRGVTFKTIYCSVMYSLEVWLLSKIHTIPVGSPITMTAENPQGQMLLEAIYAILMVSIGCAVIFHCGASSGGSDIIALIVKKYTKVSIGNAVFASDIVVATIAFILGPEVGLLSVLALLMRSFVVDGIIENITKTKYVTIITNNPETVSEVIIKDIDRGFTKYNARGGYTGEPRTIIITVCRRAQAIRLKTKLNEVDPSAFVIITDANEILGNGFSKSV